MFNRDRPKFPLTPYPRPSFPFHTYYSEFPGLTIHLIRIPRNDLNKIAREAHTEGSYGGTQALNRCLRLLFSLSADHAMFGLT